MKKVLWVLSLAALGGCVVPGPAAPQSAPPGPPLTRGEAERMVSVGVSEPVMMELVEKRGAMPLTADDLVALKKAGASDVLIQHMIASEKKAPDPSTLPPPGYAYPPATYWGPSIGFSFGVGYYYSSGSGHSHGGSGYSGKR